MPSSHVQHPHAANQSQGSIPRSRCRIEFSHEYDTLCSCRTEEWPSIRKEYIKKIKQTSKSKAEVDLISVQPAIFTNTLWFFWYTQYWFMFIQLFYCNCQLVHIVFSMILCLYWLEASNNCFLSLTRCNAEQGHYRISCGSSIWGCRLLSVCVTSKLARK